MPSQWSITILDLGNGQIAFQPAVPGAQLNQPLGVNQDDLVTWNNTTNNTLTLNRSIRPARSSPTRFRPGQVSDPMFKVGAASVTYSCTNPTTPQHSIQLPPPPPPGNKLTDARRFGRA